MSTPRTFTRPPYAEALKAWQSLLQERGSPAELTWIFDENLCFEFDPAQPGAFRFTFQTALTPPSPEADQLAYDYFFDFNAPIVFYRVGTSGGKSVCLLLCDSWFENKTAADGYWRRDEWGVFFYPGAEQPIEETRDLQRWKNRIIRNRPLHDLDFCMTLRGIHELLAHGRVLNSYEHYALKFLHLWRRMFESQR
jgi:hypothetical protein